MLFFFVFFKNRMIQKYLYILGYTWNIIHDIPDMRYLTYILLFCVNGTYFKAVFYV